MTTNQPHPSFSSRDRILAALRPHLRPGARVLEVGSGSGLDAVHLAYRLPDVTWHPTERGDRLAELVETCAALPLANVATPLVFDPIDGPWPSSTFDAIVAIGASPEVMAALSAEAPTLLAGGGILFAYDACEGATVERFDEPAPPPGFGARFIARPGAL